MKRFLVKTFIAFVIILICFIPVDIIETYKLRESNNLEYAGWNDIFHHRINADVIINGSSRAWTQFSPEIIESKLNIQAYNLGIDGSCFNRQALKYEFYRKYNKKPRFVIQNIDCFSTLGWTEGYMKQQYFPYFYNKDFRNKIFKTEPFSFAEKYIPMYRYSHFGIKNLYKGYGPMKKGYFGVESNWDGSVLDMLDSLFFNVDERTLKMFCAFLSTAQEEGIKVIMVYAPIYYGATKKIVNIKEMYAVFDSLSMLYNAPILDYYYDEICYDTAYFYNATHLNKKGSELFTTKLCHDIDSLQLLN